MVTLDGKSRENAERFEEILKRADVRESSNRGPDGSHRYAVNHKTGEVWGLTDGCLIYADGSEYNAPYRQI